MLATHSFLKSIPIPTFIVATGGAVDAGIVDGDYKYHVFTGNDDFIVESVGDEETYGDKVQYMIIGAGGSGGGGYYCGAGGAGGYRTNGAYDHTVTATTYGVVIGGGGTAVPGHANWGQDGDDSTALGETADGAGGGAPYASQIGRAGGSGGGGSGSGTGTAIGGIGGAGVYNGAHTLGVSTHQGRNGGEGWYRSGGGGGGASLVGGNGHATNADGPGGVGGDGIQNLIGTTSYGVSGWYCGGGGGGCGAGVSSTGGEGGTGGGGKGSDGSAGGAVGGTANTGGGGGGASVDYSANSAYIGGNGGTGVVIIKYKFQ